MVILVPCSAASWSDEERVSILIHELAHVSRCDCLSQLLDAIVTSLFWFHPGVWLASWSMRSEAEMAADDAVVRAGVRRHRLRVPTAWACREKAGVAGEPD